MPWAFVFRQPVQTMMSHLDPQKGNAGNALGTMRSDTSRGEYMLRLALSILLSSIINEMYVCAWMFVLQVQEAINQHTTGWSAPNEAW